LSLALAVGNQFSLAVIALAALLLMFWVAPVRPRAVIAIGSTALTVGAILLFAAYFFRPAIFWQSLLHARWIDIEPRALTMAASYFATIKSLTADSPALMLALPAALITFFLWGRARYFGNIAPLGIAALLFFLAVASPGFPGRGFHLVLLVFVFVFVAGVFADLMESRHGLLVTASIFGLLGAAALRNLVQLAFLR
jgi:hypothetical protein